MASYIALVSNFDTYNINIVGVSDNPDEIRKMLIKYCVDEGLLDDDENDISEMYNMNLSSLMNSMLNENYFVRIHKLVQGKYENTDLLEYGPEIQESDDE